MNNQTFDPKKPVYVIKSFFYGNTNSSIRHASDHPLRLEQIPADKRTSEFIKQGKVRSNIPTMIISEESGGIEIDPEAKKEAANPLETEEIKDSSGEKLPSSAPKSQRIAAKKKSQEQSTKTTK